VLLLVLTGKLLPFLPQYSEAAIYRPEGFFQKLAGRFFSTVPQVPFVSLFISTLYALAASIAVFFYFEKTQTPEILFFGLFVLSFVFETLRIIVPLRGIYEFPPVLLILGTRLLIFGRLFGVLSLFASSIYAAGLDIQKQGRVIAAIIIAILVISFKLPVTGVSWDTSFTILFAYSSMFRFADDVLMVITVISFLVAAYIRGTGDYRFVALGALLVSLGRLLLINTDIWITSFLGVIMLIAGTWFITTRLHQVYLWL
jgi:hypothetical protein